MATFPLTTPVSDLPMDMRQTFAGEFIFIKNAYSAWLMDEDSADPITDTDYPSYHSYAVTSITRVGTVATVTTTTTNTLEVGNGIIIAGADQAAYNGSFIITAITVPGSEFTYTVTGAPATPATGTITVNGGWTTVPGIVYLNDYIIVGRVDGEIQNCTRSQYTVWDPLDFTVAEKESSQLVAIAKTLNFAAIFKEWDTEFAYDAEIPPPGSPLLFQDSAYLKLGCASAQSIVEFDGGIVLMTRRDQLQRSREIHIINGLTPDKLSSPEVERLLNADDLATVYSLYLSTAGHQLYFLTLVTTGITLVCDLGNKVWGLATSLTAQSTKSVTGISRSGKVATVICPAHGYSDGDPVTIAGAVPTTYNGIVNIRYIDANTFSYLVEGAPTTPATGTITAMGYDESYLDAVAYATFQNLDVTLAETSGIIYALDRSLYQDTGVPINVSARTSEIDGGNDNETIVTYVRPIGDRIEADVLIRWNDADYDPDSYSRYRHVDMDVKRPQTSGLASTRRRSFEVRHTADTELRLEALEVQATKGYT
jgi:hypothetical protein